MKLDEVVEAGFSIKFFTPISIALGSNAIDLNAVAICWLNSEGKKAKNIAARITVTVY